MATASGRYYSEDGRATKRQKTEGMATVSYSRALQRKHSPPRSGNDPDAYFHIFGCATGSRRDVSPALS